MLTMYLIDYDSVEDTAVMGIRNISPGDMVAVFFSKNTKHLTKEMQYEIFECKTIRRVQAIESAENNALELQLASYLGYFIASHSYYKNLAIISNNSDFKSLVDYWKNKNGIDINLFSTISEALSL